MTPPANRRLRSGVFSYLGTIVTRVIVQFATLPILFANWPAERVGTWLWLYALPAYFNVVSYAFAGAGGNVALEAAQAGDWDRAREAFRASRLSSALIILAALAVVLGTAWHFAPGISARVGTTGPDELMGVAIALSVQFLAGAQTSALVIALRIGGRWPLHINLSSLGSLADIAIFALCAALSDSLVVLASGLAALRVVMLVVDYVIARRVAPALFERRRTPLAPAMRELFPPSLAFMVLAVVNVLNLQGYTLLVGFYYGTAVLAAFVGTRVIVRVIDLVTSLLYGLQYYEAGYAVAEKRALQQRQLATMTLGSLALCAGFALVLLIAGDWLQALLTDGKTRFDPAIASVLFAATAIRAVGTTPQSLLAAENRHVALVRVYLLASLAALPIVAFSASSGAPLWAVLALLIPVELALAVPALLAAIASLDLGKRQFARMLVSRQRLADVAAILRFFGARNGH